MPLDTVCGLLQQGPVIRQWCIWRSRGRPRHSWKASGHDHGSWVHLFLVGSYDARQLWPWWPVTLLRLLLPLLLLLLLPELLNRFDTRVFGHLSPDEQDAKARATVRHIGLRVAFPADAQAPHFVEDVASDRHALVVIGSERLGHVFGDVDRAFQAEATGRASLLQVRMVEVGHADTGRAWRRPGSRARLPRLVGRHEATPVGRATLTTCRWDTDGLSIYHWRTMPFENVCARPGASRHTSVGCRWAPFRLDP